MVQPFSNFRNAGSAYNVNYSIITNSVYILFPQLGLSIETISKLFSLLFGQHWKLPTKESIPRVRATSVSTPGYCGRGVAYNTWSL